MNSTADFVLCISLYIFCDFARSLKSSSATHLVDAEQRDCQRGPTNPQPQLPPSRQRSGRFQFAVNRRQSVNTFNLDFQVPEPWLGEFELGRVEQLIGRSFACGRILQGKLTRFAHAPSPPRLW